MSRYYSIGISVRDANPARALEIKEAAEDEWPFDVDDWQPSGDPDDLTAFEASATGELYAPTTEQEVAHRLIRAIWAANGGYCKVEVSATRLEDMPYETYRLDRDDFERMIAETAQNLGEAEEPLQKPEPYPVAKQFRCPRCGDRRLEEIMRDVVYVTEIREVFEGGDIDYVDAGSAEDGGAGELDRYQCRNCGWVLPCEADPVALANYLADPERECNPDPPRMQQEANHG
jgi:hypothetical protein